MFEILHRVGIKAPLSRVYEALSTPEGVAAWWTRDTTGGRKAGEIVVTKFYADGALLGSFDLRIVEADPASRFAWQVVEGPPEWLQTTITFDLKREDGFTVILFKHSGWKEPGEFMHHCSTKWATFLMSLKSYVETGGGQPSPDDVRISNWH
jgi:uncharacterized protein YndB with AHSA1/START domain